MRRSACGRAYANRANTSAAGPRKTLCRPCQNIRVEHDSRWPVSRWANVRNRLIDGLSASSTETPNDSRVAPSSLSSRKSASAFGTDRPVARLESRRDDDYIDELARRRSVSPYRRFEAAPASPVACLLRCGRAIPCCHYAVAVCPYAE